MMTTTEPGATAAPASPEPAAPNAGGDIDLLALAQAADRGEDIAPPAAPPVSATQERREPAPAPGSGKTEDGKPKADAAKASAPTEDGKKGDEPTKKSPYAEARERKAVEDGRQERSWAAINKRKAELAALEQQLAEREKALAGRERPPAKAEAPPAPARDERGRTAEDYERIARETEAEGDARVAAIAREKAKALRGKDEEAAKARQTPRDDHAARAEPEFDLRGECIAAMRDDPELQKPDSPVVREANRLLEAPETRDFFRRRGGVSAAVQVARLSLAAGEAEALRAENTKLKADLDALSRRTGMAVSPPVPPKQPPRGGPLSDEEMMRLAQEADRG